MLTIGTAVIEPCSSCSSKPRMTLMTAAIEEYSQPWIPPINESFGPSWAPWSSTAGTARSLRLISVRMGGIQYGGHEFRRARAVAGALGGERSGRRARALHRGGLRRRAAERGHRAARVAGVRDR